MVSEYQLQVVWFKPCYSYYLCHYSSLSLGLQMKDKLTRFLVLFIVWAPFFLRVYFFDASCKKKEKGIEADIEALFLQKTFLLLCFIEGWREG